MNENRVKLSIDNGIARVVLNRPNKMNALDLEMFDALIEAGKTIAADKTVRVVIISGEGKAFCAGLDMKNFAALLNPDSNSALPLKLTERTHGIANKLQFVVWLWRELRVPVIAAVHGVAVGGGLQLALAADMRYTDVKTQFSIMELKWGLIPDMSSTQLMRHSIPEDIIRELAYTARMFDSKEAKEYGFVTKVVADPLAHAEEVAAQIAARNPDAVQASKRVLNAANYVSAAEGLLMESQEQDKIIGSPNQLEAVQAALQNRPANFKD